MNWSVWKKKFTLYPAILNCNSYIFLVGPELGIDISADTTDVFGSSSVNSYFCRKNSIKHCQDRSHIKIQLKTAHVSIEQQDYLEYYNFRQLNHLEDFFPLEALNTLNHLEEHDTLIFLYKDYNVGIYNIYYRMKMIYENQSTLAFITY